MTELRQSHFQLVPALLIVLSTLAACSHRGSELAGPDKGPTDPVAAASNASTETSGSSAKPASTEGAFIYAAVIERLVKEARSDGSDSPFKVLFILDGVVPNAANPTIQAAHVEPFSHDMKDGIKLVTALGELPPIEFVTERESAVVGTKSGRQPGRARDGGALISLGPVEKPDQRVEVSSSLWVNGLWGRWQTYVLDERDGVWKVAGVTGPIAIS